jgi:hypothetical protein
MPNVGDEIYKLKHEANDLKYRLLQLSYEGALGKRYLEFSHAQSIWIKNKLAVIEIQLTLLGVKV